MKYRFKIISLAVIICSLSSCQKFLDLKPDKKQVVPATLEDCQALLNSVNVLGSGFPEAIEISSDDYYVTFEIWQRQVSTQREPYLWQTDAQIRPANWNSPYNKVLVANQVIEVLDKIKRTSTQQDQWNRIRGSALLLRSTSFYSLAQIFAQPYDVSTAGQDLGIPIRLTPSIGDRTERGTLKQTYDRIIQDFTEAAVLLPGIKPSGPAQRSTAMPAKAAAYAALARVYLVMGNYEKAYENADASLDQYDDLMDYNDIDESLYYPFERFNIEVLYEGAANGSLPTSYGLVKQDLYDLYIDGDRRKEVFFRENADRTISFKGSYVPGDIFTGLATDEVFLIRAECAARAGNIEAALTDLNALRKMRWDHKYSPLTAATAEDALKLVLLERRRELPFRAQRWSDLRRLNKDSRFAEILKRTLDGKEYTLPPNDLRYTLLIPRGILDLVDIPQNPR